MPEAFAAKARYALEALLTPLGLEPEWFGEPRIVYGDDEAGGHAVNGREESKTSREMDVRPDDERVIHLPYAKSAVRFFAERRPYKASRATEFILGGEELPALFTTESGEPDLVASTFLFLSGWHEAASADRDEHGRVPYEATLPSLLGTADRPVADAYRSALAERLTAAGMDVRHRSWDGRDWAFVPTHDVDYMRKWRPGILYREGVQNLILNRRGETFLERLDRLAAVGTQFAAGDPYRSAFTRMIDEVTTRGGTATYFVKSGAGDPHDVPYSLEDRFVRRRLADLHERGFEVALHPSYGSVDDLNMIRTERERLAAVVPARPHFGTSGDSEVGEARSERVGGVGSGGPRSEMLEGSKVGEVRSKSLSRAELRGPRSETFDGGGPREPRSVRQHYLRYDPARTPRLHVDAGFEIDSTIGFSDRIGFRRGTCLPHRLYDVERDLPLDIWEMPLAIMDSALFNRQNLELEEAVEHTAALMATCRHFRGACVVLWHNTLWDEIDCPGWGEHFTRTLDMAQRDDALIDSLVDALRKWC